MTILLASASPRRRDLLGRLGVDFTAVAADIDETPLRGEAPDALVKRLALEKARAVAASHPDALVIAADTVVVLGGDILNKPRDEEENRRFIACLSGRVHHVHTGHALVCGEREDAAVVTTAVRFRDLTAREQDWYVLTGEGLDKAGGYGVQGYGSVLVSRVEGCFFNVVGLSLAHVALAARKLGVELV